MVEVRSLIDAQTNQEKPGFCLVDRYVLTRAIRTTGVAQTFLADDTEAARQVLVVVHPAGWADEAGRVERFEARAAVLQSLEHANLGTLLDHGIADGRCFAALERFDGERLSDRLARKRGLSVEELLPVVSQLLKAVEYVHARNVVIRCLDPSHIVLCNDGVHSNIVRVTGVGVGELVQNLERPDEEELIGDPSFAAPEQLRAEPADARSDVYAVGRIMVAALQGAAAPAGVPISKRPSTGANFPLDPGLPRALLDLIEACLQPDPGARPPDGASLVEALIDAVPNASMFRLPRITGTHAALDRRRGAAASRVDHVVSEVGTDVMVEPPPPISTMADTASRRRSPWPAISVVALGLGAAALAYALWPAPAVAPSASAVDDGDVVAASAGTAGDASRAEHKAPAATREAEGNGIAVAGDAAAPVRIESNPGGEVRIDGQARGKTPFVGTLDPGAHEIEIAGETGGIWRETVEVREGENHTFVVSRPAAAAEERGGREPRRRERRRGGSHKASRSRSVTPDPTPGPTPTVKPAAKDEPAPSKERPDDPFLKPSKKSKRGTELLPGRSQE